MDDLVTWLRAQLDDDEAGALRASCHSAGTSERRMIAGNIEQDGHYDFAPWGGESWRFERASVAFTRAGVGVPLSGVTVLDADDHTCRHIARHDPARVLREVAAKRAIVELWEHSSPASYPDYDGGYQSALEGVIGHLAAVYADRDGYRPEWAPDPSG